MAATAEADANMKYLLQVIKHAEFKPNYHAVATEAGINNANNAQKKFKKLVESGGFALVNGAVVSPESTTETAVVTPKNSKAKLTSATPKAPKPRKSLPKVSPLALDLAKAGKTVASAKKRKMQESEEGEDAEDCGQAKDVSESEDE